MANYDSWKSSDPDPYSEGRGEPEAPLHRCRDCAQEITEGGHGAPWVQGVYCDPCWRWRSAQGLAFDTRSKGQIERTQRKGAA